MHMQQNLKKLILLAGAVVLTACATATPYQAATNADTRNGFSELKIENDRARISFDGNSLTKRDTVETYLLYRAAELTKQSGYDYFTLTDRATDKKTRIRSTGLSRPYYGFFDYSYYLPPSYGWSRATLPKPFQISHLGFYDPYYSAFGYDSFGLMAIAHLVALDLAMILITAKSPVTAQVRKSTSNAAQSRVIWTMHFPPKRYLITLATKLLSRGESLKTRDHAPQCY